MFSEFSVRAQQWRDFATAHSRGLRLKRCRFDNYETTLCHSAFARVATIGSRAKTTNHVLCHSAFARVATEQYQPTV